MTTPPEAGRPLARRLACLIVFAVALTACNDASDPTMCTDVQCRPPSCCGDSCGSSGDCCDGTVCSLEGRCIPSRCTSCGEAGCRVDYDACTAECAPPDSCGDPCISDADCAAGAFCGAAVTGAMLCYPVTCRGCDGLTPLCQTDTECGATCVAPARCGEACSPGSDCGAGAICHPFPSGVSHCVPEDFVDECSLCGSAGCTFRPDRCDLTCQVRDAGTPIDDGGVGPTLDAGSAPACLNCCSPCATDDDCCGGTSCLSDETGARRCYPSECGFCSYGCTFRCPG